MTTSQHITHCKQVADLLKAHMANLDHEELWGIFLTQNCRLIASEMLTMGSLTATIIDPRTVLRHALMNNAVHVIICHNHPSDDPRPSRQDIDQTKRIKTACDIMGVSLVDHIILSENAFYSFSDERVINY